MNARPLNEWPMTIGQYHKEHGEPVKIEVFSDHEEPTYAALYCCYADGCRIPARSVSPEPLSHWQSVMAAWALSAPLVDRRDNPYPPLEFTVS